MTISGLADSVSNDNSDSDREDPDSTSSIASDSKNDDFDNEEKQNGRLTSCFIQLLFSRRGSQSE